MYCTSSCEKSLNSFYDNAHRNVQREDELPKDDEVGVEIDTARSASSWVTSHTAGARAVNAHAAFVAQVELEQVGAAALVVV